MGLLTRLLKYLTMLTIFQMPLVYGQYGLNPEPSQDKKDLCTTKFVILQMRTHRYQVESDDCPCLKLPLVPFTVCVKALARLHRYAGSPEPLLFAYVINTLFSCASSIKSAYVENFIVRVLNRVKTYMKVIYHPLT